MEEKKMILLFAAIGIVSIVIEIIFPIHYHPYYWWHAFVGFDFIFGVVGGFALIFLAKKILFPLVKRDKDIYKGGKEQ